MMLPIRLVILLLLLFAGGYATHVAGKRVKEYKVTEKRMTQLKKDLTENDYAFMRIVLDHDHTVTSGSLIVRAGKIIGTGWVGISSALDSSSHAVLNAVNEATNNLNTLSLKGSILYSSTQPCPMCLSLLHLMEVDKIVYFEDSERTSLAGSELQNQWVYGSLLKNAALKWTIPTIVLRPNDLK